MSVQNIWTIGPTDVLDWTDMVDQQAEIAIFRIILLVRLKNNQARTASYSTRTPTKILQQL